jgi:hypothetical protein
LWVRRGRPERLYPSDRRLTRIGAGSEVTGVLSARRGTVWVESAGDHPGALWAAVMGLSLPHLLAARGSVVLHASCVEKDGAAVAFTGRQRAGKSSIAAALLTDGWRLVADDALLVTVAGDRVLATPSFPALRLWTPLAASLAATMGLDQAPTHPGIDKRWLFLGDRNWSERTSVELAGLCIIDEERTGRMRGSDSMLAVLASTFDPEPGLRRHWRRWFDSARRVACSIPVLRVQAPGDFKPDFRFAAGVTRELRAAGVL